MSGNFGLKLNGPAPSNRESPSTFRSGPLSLVGPFHLIFPTHSQSQSVLSMFSMEENTYHCSCYGLLTADLSLLLVRPCAETTVTVTELCYGCLDRSIPRENFECSFRHSKLVFEDLNCSKQPFVLV